MKSYDAPLHLGVYVNSIILFQCNTKSNYVAENEVRIDPTVQVESNQIDAETFIGPGSLIKEKTSVKSSTLGENCVVNPRTRISKCVFLKKVEIGEG